LALARFFEINLGPIRVLVTVWILFIRNILFFVFDSPGCPGQLARTVSNPRTYWTPCKPSRQVRHCGNNMRAQRESIWMLRKETNPCNDR
jgi:hypothetical protein